MTLNPTANHTARRNLAQRIDRFMKEHRSTSTDYQDANVWAALVALEQGDYPAGEDAMWMAEKGYRPRFMPFGRAKPVGELRAYLAGVLLEN